MLKLKRAGCEIFVPDGASAEAAVARSRYLAIGAHHDDIEQMAVHGIMEAWKLGGGVFFGVVASDGVGNRHTGEYSGMTYEELREVRVGEQREAARIGRYAGVAMLNYPSSEIKDHHLKDLDEDLVTLIDRIRPETVYLHNPFDRHDTHVALCLRTIAALRTVAAKGYAPKQVLGCEAWRGLDWMVFHDRTLLPVMDGQGLEEQLAGVFHSQFDRVRFRELAARGRRIANATFHESHSIGMDEEVTIAINMLPLVTDPSIDMEVFVRNVIERFESDILHRIRKYRDI